ncbi:hypothetical protein C8F04DRAFT_1279270 [Mycena alexandri]|uniref:Uncharacterized protein n=1 Tax=Mycena alexandri TaxID=1745969 RepID=A0AAD6WLZ4_9AGAR|nr:hypothetical protein C8F04DRAFT_1279270 [Mycena alexandri]
MLAVLTCNVFFPPGYEPRPVNAYLNSFTRSFEHPYPHPHLPPSAFWPRYPTFLLPVIGESATLYDASTALGYSSTAESNLLIAAFQRCYPSFACLYAATTRIQAISDHAILAARADVDAALELMTDDFVRAWGPSSDPVYAVRAAAAAAPPEPAPQPVAVATPAWSSWTNGLGWTATDHGSDNGGSWDDGVGWGPATASGASWGDGDGWGQGTGWRRRRPKPRVYPLTSGHRHMRRKAPWRKLWLVRRAPTLLQLQEYLYRRRRLL